MNPEEFKLALHNKGIDVTEKQMKQFDDYLILLQEWNEKINLTAITESEEVYLKHFYDSITAGLYVDFNKGVQSLCDVGAGAGFPSIPLKIIFPKLLIFNAINAQAQYFGQNKKFRESFDFVTARAVARMSVLAELCLPLVKKDGIFIALKASSSDNEMKESKKAIATLGGKFRKEFIFELPKEAGERNTQKIS